MAFCEIGKIVISQGNAMSGRKFFYITVLLLGFYILSPVFFIESTKAAIDELMVTIKISVCGDGVIEGPEDCDFYYENDTRTEVFRKGEETCQDLTYDGGPLACHNDCTFDTSACYYDESTPPPPRLPPSSPETGASFSGRAYPNSKVTLLKDAQIIATTIAGSDATFSIRITGLTTGNYHFSLYSEDYQKRRSFPLTFSLFISEGVMVNVTGIFIAPSIDVDKSEVRKGDDVAIFGQTTPEADVTIEVSGSPSFFAQTVSDKDGIYLHYFNTASLDYHTYHAKSKASVEAKIVSGFGRAVSFIVGTRTVLKERADVLRGDLNKNGRVGLADFSIAAYWYGRPLSPAMKEIECERLNCDGVINLIDFSIMAYYWTG